MQRLLPLARPVLIAFLIPNIAAPQQPPEVSPSAANEHLEKKAQPVFPALAKAARLQGVVRLHIVITEAGTVRDVKVLSGHPMFVSSAMSAVRQWQYKPFEQDGRAIAVGTTVEVPFSLGIPADAYKKEQQASNAYFAQDKKCRGQLQSRDFEGADSVCRAEIPLAEALPPTRQMERIEAYQNAGHALFHQRKFADALPLFRHELQLAEQALQPTEAELAYAYHDVALALHGTGKLQEANAFYQRSEDTLEKAREHIDGEFLKNEYAKYLKSVLRDHALLLQSLGDSSGAAALQQKADSIVVRTDLTH
jgi:TonB family protein